MSYIEKVLKLAILLIKNDDCRQSPKQKGNKK